MEKGHTIKVLDHGHVILMDSLGSDTTIAGAARKSYDQPSKGAEADAKLLKYLLKHGHTSPFEQASITFEIKMPILVMRQFVRQRTFRLNEMSARYTELPDEFYVPTEYREQSKTDKQSSNKSEELNHKYAHTIVHNNALRAYQDYKDLLEAGVAREMARMVLPVNIYTKIVVSCDIHNLMKFLKQRLDSHAQYEIRMFAIAMRDIAQELYPSVFKVFNNMKFTVEYEGE